MSNKRSVADYINNKKYCAYACVDPKTLVGPEGPQGPQGPSGPQGPQGDPGVDGADGKTVLNGTVDPTTEGTDGDFYINTTTDMIFGPKTGGSWGTGTSLIGPPGVTQNTVTYSANLNIRQASNTLYFTGVDRSITTGQIGDYTTAFALHNNHLFIDIQSATGLGASPQMVISGTALSESTGVASPSETETIFITSGSSAGSYQSIKKWYLVTSIVFTNITPTYNIGVLGYLDFGNINIRLKGYRFEILGDDDSRNSYITLQIIKIKNGSSTSLITLPFLENITVDGTNGDSTYGRIVDNLRTSPFNRNYTMTNTNLWPQNSTFVLKQTDFDTYFSSTSENIILGGSNEGIIIKISTDAKYDFGNAAAPRFATITLYYEDYTP